MLLLVGLGNPGPAYERHRHNVGFMAVDEIARRHSFAAWRTRFQGLLAEGNIAGEKTFLLKPQTFMNESGRSVGEIVRFFKLPLENVAVFYDELDLALGRIRVKTGGGHAGHNGVRSLDAQIGNDFRRVRIGIGRPDGGRHGRNYVLHDFSKAEMEVMQPLLEAMADATPLLARGDDPGFMTRVALLTRTEEKPASAPKNTTANGDKGSSDGI